MKVKSYSCPSCGADLEIEQSTHETIRAYCGQPFVIEDRGQEEIRSHQKSFLVILIMGAVIVLATVLTIASSILSKMDQFRTAEHFMRKNSIVQSNETENGGWDEISYIW